MTQYRVTLQEALAMFGDPDNPRLLDGPVSQQMAFEAGCVVSDGFRRVMGEQLELIRGIRECQKLGVRSQGYVMIPAAALNKLNSLITNMYPPTTPRVPDIQLTAEEMRVLHQGPVGK